MKATATLETVIDRVHQMSANQYDEIVPVQDMEFDSLNQCGFQAGEWKFCRSAPALSMGKKPNSSIYVELNIN